MPGCTAPNCTNSSQKGYKLYHFPSDPERCVLWVKYCGREKNWQPTKHTCLCETHFEECQFESHRADGLKKLKPFAIPTKFSKLNPRATTKKKVNEVSLNPAQKCEGTENIFISKDSLVDKAVLNNENIQYFSEVITSSESSEFLRKCNEFERNKRRKCQTTVSFKNSVRTIEAELEFEKVKQKSELKRKKAKKSSSCDVLNESKFQTMPKDVKFHPDCYDKGETCQSVGKKKKKINSTTLSKNSLKCLLHQSAAAVKNVEKTKTTSKTNVCFICDQNIEKCVPLSSCTETSITQFDQKLIQLLVQEFDILVEDSGMLCKICAQTLNCIDYVESVLHTLSKEIINRMKKKFGMQPTEEIDLPNYIKYLKNLSDFYPCKEVRDIHFSQTKNSNQLYSYQDSNQSRTFGIIEAYERKNNRKQVSTRIKFECQICSFKTCFKAVMVFHLRQHYQQLYSCDFCNTPVAFDPSLSYNSSHKGTEFLKNKKIMEVVKK